MSKHTVSQVTDLSGEEKPEGEEEDLDQSGIIIQEVPQTSIPLGGGIPTPLGGGISTTAPREAGFINAQKLVAANIPQTQALAERISKGLKQTAQETIGAIEQAGTQFQQQVTAGLPGSFQQDESQAFITQSIEAPTLLTDEDKLLFSELTTGQFGGPSTFEGGEQFIPLSQQVTEAERIGGLAGTSIGRRELLLSDQSGRTRSRGVRALNELLIGATPGASRTLQQAAGEFSNIPQLLQQTAETGTAFSLQQQEALDVFQQQALEQLGGARTDIRTGLEQRVAERQEIALAEADIIRQVLSTGRPLNQQQADVLGLTTEQAIQLSTRIQQAQAFERLLGTPERFGSVDFKALLPSSTGGSRAELDLRQQAAPSFDPASFAFDPLEFLTQISPETAFTQQTVATQEEIARLEALRQLGGI